MMKLTSHRQAIQQKTLTFLGACVLFSSLSGCAGLPVDETEVKKKLNKPKGNPTQIVLTANPCLLQDNNNKPNHTGLFCRMYFFQGNDPVPMNVIGDMKVIAFDAEKGGSAEKPEGIYNVSNGELEKHLRPDVVGDSYVFWFHYQTTEIANLEVRATVKLKNGKEITSGPVKIQLDPNNITTEDALAKLSSRKAGARKSNITYIDDEPAYAGRRTEREATAPGSEAPSVRQRVSSSNRQPVPNDNSFRDDSEVKPVNHSRSSGEL